MNVLSVTAGTISGDVTFGGNGDVFLALGGSITGSSIDFGGGRDTLVLSGGSTTNFDSSIVDGGTGTDTITGAEAAFGIFVSLASFAGFENLIGSAFNDELTGSNQNNVLIGGAGADIIDGQDGLDTVDYSASAAGVTINLVAGATATGVGGDAQGDQLTNIERIMGSAFTDLLTNTGDGAADYLDGGAGDDALFNFGTLASDLIGGFGNDFLVNQVGATADELFGNSGNDNLNNFGTLLDDLNGGTGNDVITNSGTADDIFGELGDDVIINSGTLLDDLNGGSGNDVITNSGTLSDDIFGGDGDDVITNSGTAGDDIFGSSGDDVITNSGNAGGSIFGDDGDDTVILLDGSMVAGEIDGGIGNDTLSFAGQTSGVNFTSGDDLSIVRFENFIGTDQADTIIGDALVDNVIDGGDGNDTLIGGAVEGVQVFRASGEIENATDGNGTAGSTLSQFNFTVAEAGRVTIDILSAELDTNGDGILSSLDSQIRVFLADPAAANGLGAQIGVNDDGDGLDGSVSSLDSFLTLDDLAAGNYVLVVGELVFFENEARAGFNENDTLNTDNDGAFVVTFSGVSAVENGVSVVLNSNDTLNGGDGDDFLLGGFGDDILNGGDDSDVLDGGTGTDILAGGAGDDFYIVDELGDQIIEDAGNGTDTVFILGPVYALAENIEIASVFVTDQAVALSGNASDNTLILASDAAGNIVDAGAGNDTLFFESNTVANGGIGNDVLVSQGDGNFIIGGLGDDTYIIQGANDTLLEEADGGADTVFALNDFTLSSNIETLALISFDGSAINGTGNASANTIIGSSGTNILSGLEGADFIVAGAGNDLIIGGTSDLGTFDVLQGNAGADTFLYNSVSDGGDIIQDFVGGEDSFSFSASAFGFDAGEALVEGVNFFAGETPVAAGAEASFLFDTLTNSLFYDADGSGDGAAVLIADLQDFATVSVDDFAFF